MEQTQKQSYTSQLPQSQKYEEKMNKSINVPSRSAEPKLWTLYSLMVGEKKRHSN